MTVHASEKYAALIVTIGSRACAIPLSHVAEIMRPLPIEPIARMPDFIRGISLIRGIAVPVVDLTALVSNCVAGATYQRLVSVKLGDRRVALGVDGVVGVKNLDAAQFAELPPLFREGNAGPIEAIGMSDAQLLLILRATRLVPDEVWTRLELARSDRTDG